MDFKTALGEIVKKPHSFTLFTAPLGWGKTRIIWDLLETNSKIILLCPLRSIVEEVKSRENTFSFEGENKTKEFKRFLRAKKGIFACTVESFMSLDIKEIINEHKPLFVFDEFHLFLEWGTDFRPVLFDIYRDIITLKGRLLAVTATCPGEMIDEVKQDCSRNDFEFHLIDIGNFKFRTDPKKIVKLSKKDLLCDFEITSRSPLTRGRILLFVKSLHEVQWWFQYCKSRGVSVNFCVGGDVQSFVQREGRYSKVIIATSVLSHGVNFRNMRHVYISYSPSSSFKTQMLGRGGRFGEKFIGYTINTSQQISLLSKIGVKIRRFVRDIQLGVLNFVL